MEFSKAERGGRIYVDIGRNGPSATFAAAYAVRAKPGAPVSAPCTWDEVADGKVKPRSFSLRSMPARIDSVGDVWQDMQAQSVSLKSAIKQLGASGAEQPARRSRGRW
jgi:bifunctional non-homologous end joining protein LigD